MRVALINKFYPPKVGGIEYHVRLLAQHLANKECIDHLDILVANEKNVLRVEQINNKVSLTRLPSWLTLQSTPIAPKLASHISKLNVDLFHFHFPYPFADFSWLLSGDSRPYCITYHSDIIRQRVLGKLYKPIMNRFFEKSSAIIATSPQLVDSSSVLQRYKDKVHVIPLGIDPDPFNSDFSISKAKEIKSKFSDKPIVLFVGRFVYYKGVDILVKAFKEIDAHLLLVGQGPLDNELKRMVLELNITDKVHFITQVSDELMPAYFNACDIFVLPSVANTEAYGLVQLEAHASGKPVISTDLATGVPFVNKNRATGVVVKPGDVEVLAKAINELVQNEGLRKCLGAQAKERMLNNFTAKVMTEKIVGVYRSILKRG